jgi:hypothetical protein
LAFFFNFCFCFFFFFRSLGGPLFPLPLVVVDVVTVTELESSRRVVVGDGVAAAGTDCFFAPPAVVAAAAGVGFLRFRDAAVVDGATVTDGDDDDDGVVGVDGDVPERRWKRATKKPFIRSSVGDTLIQ